MIAKFTSETVRENGHKRFLCPIERPYNCPKTILRESRKVLREQKHPTKE